MSAALLVVDMINDFLLPGAPLEVPMGRDIIPSIEAKIDFFVEYEQSVIFVSDGHYKGHSEFRYWPEHAMQGTKGAEIYGALGREDYRVGIESIEKISYSGFLYTSLDMMLMGSEVDEVYLTGIMTDVCIFVTAIEAQMRGFEVYIYKDSVATLSQEANDRALETLEKTFKVNII